MRPAREVVRANRPTHARFSPVFCSIAESADEKIHMASKDIALVVAQELDERFEDYICGLVWVRPTFAGPCPKIAKSGGFSGGKDCPFSTSKMPKVGV